MGTLYIDTGGSATNSGSTDSNSATLSGSTCSNSSGVLTLDAGTDLSSVVTTPGPTQSSIYVTGATNTNRKIFWISAVSGSGGATPQVTVDVSVTGSLSSWWIGGRAVLTNASQEGAVRAGDTALFNNSPASQAGTCWTFRNAGDSTSGVCKIKGKDGVRPVLTTTGNASAVSSNVAESWIENFELVCSNASPSTTTIQATAATIFNVKVSDAGVNGMFVQSGATALRIVGCEIASSSIGGDGINLNTSSAQLIGNYIHDVGGDGIEILNTAPVNFLAFNIVDSCSARGIFQSSGSVTVSATAICLLNNTIYGCGNSGFEVTDADVHVLLMNNIGVNNGDAAGEYNVEWAAGSAELICFHGWNNFYSALGGGSGNLLNLTANSTEITTDPAMTSPGSGDFSLPSTSGAKATAFPGQFLGANRSYLDMGAVQRQEPTGGVPMLVNSCGLVG